MPEIVKTSKSSEFVSLSEAYLHPNLYGDISQMFVDYTPDKESVTIAPMPSVSLIREQKIKLSPRYFPRKSQVEKIIPEFEMPPEHLGWKAWVRTNKKGEVLKIYFVATGLTSPIMFGRNESGWKDVVEISDQIVSAFGNQKLGIEGVKFTMDIYEAMPENLKPQTGHCMIFSSMNCEVMKNSQFHYLDNGQQESIVTYYNGYGLCTASVEFLPIVEVPTDILVKVGSQTRNGLTPERSLRIKLPKTQTRLKAEPIA